MMEVEVRKRDFKMVDTMLCLEDREGAISQVT